MKDYKYSPEPIIEDYTKKCEVAGHPLDRYQVGLLKNTVRNFFRYNKDPTPQAAKFGHYDYKPFDIELFLRIAKEEKLFHPHSLITLLQTYKYGEKGEGLKIADKDALDFYNLIVKESEYKEYVAISREYGLKNLRLGNISVLHSYLKVKHLIDESSKLLLPPSDRDTRVNKRKRL